MQARSHKLAVGAASIEGERMIHQIGKCPYCETVIAADWVNSKFVFNPDSHHPVCEHVAYIDGRITYWGKDFTQVDCTMGLLYESVEALNLRDEFDLRGYMSRLRDQDKVNPQVEYVTSKFRRDCREAGLPTEKDEHNDFVDFDAWLVFTKDASSFFQACEDDWDSLQTSCE